MPLPHTSWLAEADLVGKKDSSHAPRADFAKHDKVTDDGSWCGLGKGDIDGIAAFAAGDQFAWLAVVDVQYGLAVGALETHGRYLVLDGLVKAGEPHSQKAVY